MDFPSPPIELQPKHLAQFLLQVLDALQVVHDALRELSQPDIDEGEDKALLAAVMLVDGAEAHPGLAGDVADIGLVKIGVRKNIQYRCFEPLMNLGFERDEHC